VAGIVPTTAPAANFDPGTQIRRKSKGSPLRLQTGHKSAQLGQS
jgi:hypothetical protein